MTVSALFGECPMEEPLDKEAEARNKAEWRKTGKQLKAKDEKTKLAAIAKCAESLKPA